MHLAVLGICPLSRGLALAAASEGHRLSWYGTDEDRAAAELGLEEYLGRQVTMQQLAAWESLLDSPAIDGVVLAAPAAAEVELRSEQWRRLAQDGAAILPVHPVMPSLLVYLEIDMLARESGAVLVPYWPDAHSDGVATLERLAVGPDYGVGRPRVEEVSFRRMLEDRSPESVTEWFARDAALLDLLAGPFTEIAAIGPDDSDASYASLAVHLHGPSGIPVRWEVARPQADQGAVLTARSDDGDLEIDFDAFSPETADGEQAASSEARAALAAFEATIQAPSPALDRWHRCVRALELADSIEISLRRGRRIDVYYRQLTEETSYKGVMSAVGCGLLLLAPLVLVVAGILSSVFGWRLAKFWYAPVLVIFVGFLLLQLAARIMAKRAATEAADVAQQFGRNE